MPRYFSAISSSLRQRLVRRVAPELLAHALVQALGEGLGQAVGQRLDHDRRVVVVGALEALGDLVLADAGGDREGADIVGEPASRGATKSASATLARPSRLDSCWRSVCSVAIGLPRASSA